MLVVLAGSISAERVQEVIELRTDLVAVRGAACDAGRGGTISADRVRRLKQLATPHTNSAAQCR